MLFRFNALLVVSLLMVACTDTSISSPTSQPVISLTNTPAVTQVTVPNATREESNGEVLFNQFFAEVGFACATCHYTDTDRRLIGPGLLNVDARYEKYDVDADNLEAYLHNSIVDPPEFIAPEDPPFPANVMPGDYAEIFSDDEIDDLVTYILSLTPDIGP